MPVVNSHFRSLTCDGPDCKKTTTFQVVDDQAQMAEVLNESGREWLKAVRFLNTTDGRVMIFCSDECEVKSVATGKHNKPEPKRITEATNSQVELAAQAAKQAQEATAAIKSGQPVTLG